MEKIVSLAAGTASAAFTHSVGEPATFDGRIWVGAQDQTVVDYFLWCQFDATRCCLNGWSYWTLRKEGWTVADATKELEGKNSPWKQEMLFQRGINFNDLPTWQKRGIGIRNAEETRTGVDPRNGEEVEAIRRTLTIDDELPMTESYASYVRALLSDPKTT